MDEVQLNLILEAISTLFVFMLSFSEVHGQRSVVIHTVVHDLDCIRKLFYLYDSIIRGR